MADKMPNYYVEQQKLRVQIANLEANLERFKLEIMEADSRKEQAHVNIKATEEAIARTREGVASLVEAHGTTKKKEK